MNPLLEFLPFVIITTCGAAIAIASVSAGVPFSALAVVSAVLIGWAVIYDRMNTRNGGGGFDAP